MDEGYWKAELKMRFNPEYLSARPKLAKVYADADRRHVAQAKIDDPEGAICGHCGAKSDYADDCGWWYHNNDAGEYRAACIGCALPPSGDR